MRRKRQPTPRPRQSAAPTLPGRLLAVDLGSNRLGWASADLDASGRVVARDSGAVDLEAMAGQGQAARWQRVSLFAKWLTLQLDRGVTWLAIEEPHTNKDHVGTRHLLHGLYAFAMVISLRRLGQPARSVSRIDVFKATVGWCLKPSERQLPSLTPPKTLGGLVQQVGRIVKSRRPLMRCPTKREVMAAVNARHGSSIVSEDEADAVAMLDLCLSEIAGSGMQLAARAEAAKPLPPAPLLDFSAIPGCVGKPIPITHTPGGRSARTSRLARLQLELAEAGIGGAPLKTHSKAEKRLARAGPLLPPAPSRPVRGRSRPRP